MNKSQFIRSMADAKARDVVAAGKTKGARR